MKGYELQAGDIWVDRAGGEVKWMRVPQAGDPISVDTILVNGEKPKVGAICHSVIRNGNVPSVTPREDVTIFRGGECIHDGGMLT